MGWNKVVFKNNDILNSSEIFRFYFVHSYYADTSDDYILCKTNYSHEFASGIRYKKVFGTQFHPEKSHEYGINFLETSLVSFMLEKRVIPSLLLKDGFLHKGKNFSNHRYVGDPINAVRLFNEKKVDELCIFDITKSIECKSPDINLLESIVSEAFMPISYGGGIASVDQADELFKIGIEKIFLNSSYFQNFDLINQLTDKFGVQSICLSIDYKKYF